VRQFITEFYLANLISARYVVALTSEEEEKNCCVRRTHNCFVIIHTQQEATPQ
jgi:hypothetical protein